MIPEGIEVSFRKFPENFRSEISESFRVPSLSVTLPQLSFKYNSSTIFMLTLKNILKKVLKNLILIIISVNGNSGEGGEGGVGSYMVPWSYMVTVESYTSMTAQLPC